MLFIDAVNRMLRVSGYIRGDTDALTNFAGLQHNATVQQAVIAVQNSLNDIAGGEDLAVERVTATLTLSATVRTYALPDDFAQMWQDAPFFYDATANIEIFEYRGGERQLQIDYMDYRDSTKQAGYPNWWYLVDAATKTVGFFQIPTANEDQRVLTYDYEKDVMVSAYNDTLPFQRDAEAMAFVEMAQVYFEAIKAGQAATDVRRLPTYVSAMAKCLRLMREKKPAQRYGYAYR
jgi:hypothetical protein